jgi:WD40 repeat protein
MIFSSCVDGLLRIWDARSGLCLRAFEGHQDMLLDFALTNGSAVVTASEDHTCRVFNP